MYIYWVLVFCASLVFILIVAKFISSNKGKLKFYSKGSSCGFKRSEIKHLWNAAKRSHIQEVLYIFTSVPVLNKCIAMIHSEFRRNAKDNTIEFLSFDSKLLSFRRELALKSSEGIKITSSVSLDKGQKISIIYEGKGIFISKINENSTECVIDLPQSASPKYYVTPKLTLDDWNNKKISVYAYRKNDACYVFDTVVLRTSFLRGKPQLYLRQTNKLVRMQKRRSVRTNCKIDAQMYVIKSKIVSYDVREKKDGFKCVLENLSEDGAMIRIGGKAKRNVMIKLQFNLNTIFTMMYGIVQAVEYDKELNQSRLHFECTHIDKEMKNSLLNYIYDAETKETEQEAALRLSFMTSSVIEDEKDDMFIFDLPDKQK